METMNNQAIGYERLQNEDPYKPEQHMVAPTSVVIHSAGATSYPAQSGLVRWSWCHLVTAVFSLWCCTTCGVVATVSSILSYADHKTKDYERARHKRSVALCCGITSIVLGTVALIAFIIIMVFYMEELKKMVQQNDVGSPYHGIDNNNGY